MASPKYVANGTYGCVMRPHIPCSKKTEKHDGSKISKLFTNFYEAISETETVEKIIGEIDPNFHFTIKLHDLCDTIASNFPKQELSKCRNFKDKNTSKLKQIVYEYGGIDLIMAAKTISFEEIFFNLENIFQGLIMLCDAKYAHLDIKPANIVYNQESKKMALIDFGLCTNLQAVYTHDLLFALATDYPYYPPEFKNVVNLLRGERLTKTPWANLDYLHDRLKSDIFDRLQLDMLKASYMDFYKSISSQETINKQKEFIKTHANKIDVYMMGCTILHIMSICENSNTASANSEFNAQVLNLVENMIYMNPIKRLDPKNALLAYLKIKNKMKTTFLKNVVPLMNNTRNVQSI